MHGTEVSNELILLGFQMLSPIVEVLMFKPYTGFQIRNIRVSKLLMWGREVCVYFV
jgi:hypothetical protein